MVRCWMTPPSLTSSRSQTQLFYHSILIWPPSRCPEIGSSSFAVFPDVMLLCGRAAMVIEQVQYGVLQPRPAAIVRCLRRPQAIHGPPDRPARQVAVEHSGVDVGAPGYGRRVP